MHSPRLNFSDRYQNMLLAVVTIIRAVILFQHQLVAATEVGFPLTRPIVRRRAVPLH